MKTKRRLSGLFLVAILFSRVGILLAEGPPIMSGDDTQRTKAEYAERLNLISSLGKARDLDGLERVGEEIEKDWDKWKEGYYFDLTDKLCDEIRSWSFADTGRQDFLEQKYARRALQKPGTIPLETELNLVLHLQEDFGYTDGSLTGRAWSEERSEKARLWLRAWSRLEGEIDKDFDFTKLPEANVAPPPSLGLPAGVAPEHITDPGLRAEYEAAITRNKEETEKYNWQYRLRNLDQMFSKRVSQYLITAYSRTPFDTKDLKVLLDRYIADEEKKASILEATARKTKGQDK